MAKRSAAGREGDGADPGGVARGVPQAAVVAIRGGRVCLITSSSGRRWLVPKGKCPGSRGLRATARREAWEEAGLVGRLAGRPLGRYEFHKAGCRHVVVVYRMRVTAAAADWPERRKRLRDWVRPADVPGRIDHPGLRELLRAALAGRRAA